MVDAINGDPKITTRGNLIGPSLSNTQTEKGWTSNAIWNTNYIGQYGPALGALAAERSVLHFRGSRHPRAHALRRSGTQTTIASRKATAPDTRRTLSRSSPTTFRILSAWTPSAITWWTLLWHNKSESRSSCLRPIPPRAEASTAYPTPSVLRCGLLIMVFKWRTVTSLERCFMSAEWTSRTM